MQLAGSSCEVHRNCTGITQEVHRKQQKHSNIKLFPGVKRNNVTLKIQAINNNNLNDDDYYGYLESLKQTKHRNSNPVSVKEIYASCETTMKGSVQFMEEELMTIDEVEAFLSRSRRMVYQYIKDGKLRKVEKVINGRKRTMIPQSDAIKLYEEIGIDPLEAILETDAGEGIDIDAAQEILSSYTPIAQEEFDALRVQCTETQEETASYEIIEPSQEPAQEETKYLVDVWAEVDRRIAQAVEPYRQQVDVLTAQNKVLFERLKGIEEQHTEVDKFITEWREDKQKRKEKKPWWAFWS